MAQEEMMPKSCWDPDNAPSGEDHPDDMMLCEVSDAYDTGAVPVQPDRSI
jgi:hypothetical protein